MKRIIEGKTYNTATAALIAVARCMDQDERVAVATGGGDVSLYLTREGDFFVHYKGASLVATLCSDEPGDVDEAIWPLRTETDVENFRLTDLERFNWAVENVAALSRLVSPEEIASLNGKQVRAEAAMMKRYAREATIYIRVPFALKQSVADCAALKGESVNEFAMRAVERGVREALTHAAAGRVSPKLKVVE